MKKTGRPTDNPKDKVFQIRTNKEELEKLQHCAKELGITKAQVISKGIDMVFKQVVEDK